MQAGRELDALVAEKVMGWTWGDTGNGREGLFPPRKLMNYIKTLVFDDRGHWGGMPHYSTNIADAWEVMEKGRKDFGYIDIYSYATGYEVVIRTPEEDIRAMRETAPLAICSASVKAVEQCVR